MSTIRTFRDLIAWQRSMDLSVEIYQLTSKLPETERFGLASQMRRSAVSVPSNIAEGYARQSKADYLKFLRIARASLAELSTQIEISQRTGLVAKNQAPTNLLEETDRVLQGLIRSLTTKR